MKLTLTDLGWYSHRCGVEGAATWELMSCWTEMGICVAGNPFETTNSGIRSAFIAKITDRE